VDPRAGLDTEARGKILCPRRGSNPDRPVVQPVARLYTDKATWLKMQYAELLIIKGGGTYSLSGFKALNVFEPVKSFRG